MHRGENDTCAAVSTTQCPGEDDTLAAVRTAGGQGPVVGAGVASPASERRPVPRASDVALTRAGER